MKIIQQVTRASARRPGRDTCKLRSPSTQAHLSITSRCDVLLSTYVHGMPERISSVKEENKKTIGQMLLLQLEVGKTSCRVEPSSLVVQPSLPTAGRSYLTIGASRTDSCSIYIRPVGPSFVVNFFFSSSSEILILTVPRRTHSWSSKSNGFSLTLSSSFLTSFLFQLSVYFFPL